MTATLYLRFPDEAAATAAIDGMAERGVTVDMVGQIVRVVTPATLTVPAVTATLPGYHINLRGETPEDRAALAAYVVQPAQPHRVFA